LQQQTGGGFGQVHRAQQQQEQQQQKEKKKNSNKNLKWILSREICNWNPVSTTHCAAAIAANFLV
jgi:hypothetical protein